jgi:uncharacterized protein (TIGR02001 family)
MGMNRFTRTAGATGIALLAMAGAALADGYEVSSKDAPAAAEGRKLTWSITLGATSDYVFRGLSLSDEKPAAQGSIDLSYGIFYAGVWGSNLDDGLDPELNNDGVGPGEVDVYAGFKPVVGPVTFDLGIIGYLYPGEGYEGPGDAEYLELKAGASFAPITNATLGGIIYYSPKYQYTDDSAAIAVEGSAGYTFRQVGPFVPTLSGVFGWQEIEDQDFGGGDEDYLYWNVGVALAVDKLTLDLRYWDTNIEEDAAFISHGLTDERFVASIKVTLP